MAHRENLRELTQDMLMGNHEITLGLIPPALNHCLATKIRRAEKKLPGTRIMTYPAASCEVSDLVEKG